MRQQTLGGGGTLLNPVRVAGWTFALAVLATPLVAMQFTREVNWTLSDFAVFGAMLLTAGIALELLLRKPGGLFYRIAATLAVVGVFVMVWGLLASGP